MKKPVQRMLRRSTGRKKFVSVEEPFPSEAGAAFEMLVRNFALPIIRPAVASDWGAISFGFYDKLGSDASTKILARDLERFALTSAKQPENQSATMLAVFRGPFEVSELEFEKLFRAQLQKLQANEAQHFRRNSRSSPQPNESDLPFSFAGSAYYVIGMHANSPHQARQFPWPTLVFNPRRQFEPLRGERIDQTSQARDFSAPVPRATPSRRSLRQI